MDAFINMHTTANKNNARDSKVNKDEKKTRKKSQGRITPMNLTRQQKRGKRKGTSSFFSAILDPRKE